MFDVHVFSPDSDTGSNEEDFISQPDPEYCDFAPVLESCTAFCLFFTILLLQSHSFLLAIALVLYYQS